MHSPPARLSVCCHPLFITIETPNDGRGGGRGGDRIREKTVSPTAQVQSQAAEADLLAMLDNEAGGRAAVLAYSCSRDCP